MSESIHTTEAPAAENTDQKVREAVADIEKSMAEAQLAIAEGKGVLKLAKPITDGMGREHDSLSYDFGALSVLEYSKAMDSDTEATKLFRMSNRQAVALFAVAAAKEADGLDDIQIIQQLGVQDGIKAAQVAQVFFVQSTQSANLRLTRK